MNWNQTLTLAIVGGLAFFWGGKVLEALGKINEQLGNVRYMLGEIEKRQQRMAESLHQVDHHTRQAVRDKPSRSWFDEHIGDDTP